MKTLLLASALIAGAVGVSGIARADDVTGCQPETLWVTCGAHIPAKRLPLTFSYNPAGAPVNVKATTAPAIDAAIGEWDMFWPVPGLSCAPLCFDGTTSATLGLDGVNAVVWDSPSKCGGNDATTLAITCTWYEAASGADATRIKEVDIVLNPAMVWATPSATDPSVIAGDAIAAAPTFLSLWSWYDVQSVLTHEFGHAIGLGHIGDPNTAWPSDLTDSGKHLQTMYRYYYAGTTNKRTLEAGDIAGELQIAHATESDGGPVS